jgi:hypothetical protein
LTLQTLQLDKPFAPTTLLKGAADIKIKIGQAYIETRELTHVFETLISINQEPSSKAINIAQVDTPAWSTLKAEEVSNGLEK